MDLSWMWLSIKCQHLTTLWPKRLDPWSLAWTSWCSSYHWSRLCDEGSGSFFPMSRCRIDTVGSLCLFLLPGFLFCDEELLLQTKWYMYEYHTMCICTYIYIYCGVLWKRHAAGPQENHWQHIILTRKYNANWTFSARQFKQHWKKRTSRHAECALSRQNHKHFPQCARALCVFWGCQLCCWPARVKQFEHCLSFQSFRGWFPTLISAERVCMVQDLEKLQEVMEAVRLCFARIPWFPSVALPFLLPRAWPWCRIIIFRKTRRSGSL